MQPYYSDRCVELYLGDAIEVLAGGGLVGDVIVTDPPYGETSFGWDSWPAGWPSALAASARQLWCFGSMRMFLAHAAEFDDWKLAQDVVWEKHNGAGFAADRFRRVHELALHWYQGRWSELYHEVPKTFDAKARVVRRAPTAPRWHGARNGNLYTTSDGGPRLMRSVIKVRSEHRRSTNETQKPLGIVSPLIEFSCPPRGLVLDPFAGAGTTLVATKMLGRRAIGVELREDQCEAAARRLQATQPAERLDCLLLDRPGYADGSPPGQPATGAAGVHDIT